MLGRSLLGKGVLVWLCYRRNWVHGRVDHDGEVDRATPIGIAREVFDDDRSQALIDHVAGSVVRNLEIDRLAQNTLWFDQAQEAHELRRDTRICREFGSEVVPQTGYNIFFCHGNPLGLETNNYLIIPQLSTT